MNSFESPLTDGFFPKPLNPKQALEFIATLISSDDPAILKPTDRHLDVLAGVIKELAHPSGNLFHDIHTATLMREHGIPEIVTADTDFFQFSFLKVTNPLFP